MLFFQFIDFGLTQCNGFCSICFVLWCINSDSFGLVQRRCRTFPSQTI
jgi:hypothetical protein